MSTQVEKMLREHPIRMRWESLKLNISCFLWRFHPGRNRWCDKCKQFTGNSRKAHLAHYCPRALEDVL